VDAHDAAGNRMQNGARDARTHVNRSKGRDGIEPPRTVREQLDELEVQLPGETHRRRDPVRAAAAQHVHRDNGVGGAWISTSQGAGANRDDVFFEKIHVGGRRRFGSDMQEPMRGDTHT
jgi:hypothetical protein